MLLPRKKKISDGYMAYLSTKETSAVTQNRSRQVEKRKRLKDSFTSEEDEELL